ncbi:MAG: AraC family transcriptional regulator [Betaproteobacteria bacterium]|nr:AraC family transcriptional regulator [Betaproteobacteria bacterium]
MQRSVAEGTARVGPLMAIPALLHEFGVDPVGLLSEFDLDPGHFDEPENFISFSTGGRILGRCVERTGCAHFGLLVGQRAGLSALGAFGFLMQSAPDVRTALKGLVEHLRVQDRGAIATFSEEGAYAVLGYAILKSGVENCDQILDLALAILLNVMRGLCGQNWHPTQAHFAHQRPHDEASYRHVFRALPRFNAEQTALVFPVRWLDRPIPSADPLLHRLMGERVSELESQMGEDLVGQLRRVLRTLVPSPGCSLAVVAKRVGMHGRTLNRRLSAEGTSFLQLREEVRYEAASQLLENTRTPANQIAMMLGYTDASSFTRAFRRWSGMGPAQWRASRSQRSHSGSRGRKRA